MATLSLQVREARADSQGYAPVRLRISHRGKRRFVSFDLSVLVSKWSRDRQLVSRSHPQAQRVNRRLREVMAQAQAALTELETSGAVVTAQRVKQAIEEELHGPAAGLELPEGPAGFIEYWRRELAGYERRGQYGTHKSYRSIFRKFKEFLQAELGESEIGFEQIDPRLIRDFRTYCYEERKNSANTVGKALNILRTMVRSAMQEGYIERSDYPFEHITIDSEPVQKELLTPEQIEQLDQVELEPDSVLAEVRRWFMFAYQAGGMRFSDVATLRPDHIKGGRIYYRMEKTSDAVGVPLTTRAREILAHYKPLTGPWVFPILEGVDPDDAREVDRQKKNQNALANKYLKKLADKAELGQAVTFHLSRNAAAWRFYQRVGDIYKTSKLLGHTSVTQTEEYLAGFEDESIDEDFLAAFD